MKIKKQEDIRDCGLSILQAFHNYFYNRWININDFKRKASYGLKGINVEGICELAQTFGMKLSPLKGNFEALKELKLESPIIALIGNEEENHYVIIEKIKNNSIKITDPMTGQSEFVAFKKFEYQFLDVIIQVEKTSYSYKHVKTNSIYEYLLQFKTTIPWILLSMCISIIVVFSSSFFMKIIMDQIIPGALTKTLTVLFAGFVLIGILGALNNGFKNFIIYKMSLHISMEITEKFNNKIKNSNLLEVQKLTRTDLMRRAAFIEPVSLFISTTIFAVTSEITICLVASSILIWINIKLFLISAIVVVVLVLITLVSQSLLNKKYGKYIKNQIDYSSINLDALTMIKQTKYPPLKLAILTKQSKALYNYKKIDKKIWITNNIYEVIQNIITSLAPLLIVLLATQSVIKEKMSLGSLVLYISMFHFFVNPTISITQVLLKYPLIKKEMDMLQYVLDFKDEKINPKGKKINKLNNIMLKNISFGYETGKKILEIKSFEINKNIVLKGANGSGKTTLLDIISTTYNIPGIFYNNLETKYYDLNNLRSEIYKVTPTDHIPNMTILEFITNNDLKKYDLFLKNLELFNLSEILDTIGIPLNKMMLNNASNLSAGQRQIVQILCLFTKRYKLIILDEAFENIESKIVVKLIKKINEFCEGSLFIEISHNNIFVKQKSKEISIETLKQN